MGVLIFWINAFIPREVPGYTIALTSGTHAGKTAIPLPDLARTWPGNLFKHLNCGFLTDQRSFFDSPTSSVRMRSRGDFEVTPTSVRFLGDRHETSGTTQVNTSSGDQTGFAKADMSRCSLKPLASKVQPGPFPNPQMPVPAPAVQKAILELSAAAGDPLVGMAADIDYNGTLTVGLGKTPNSVDVSFEGKIDSFPAYDCYASYNGVTKALFKIAPPMGNTVTDLLGAANTPVSGSVSFT